MIDQDPSAVHSRVGRKAAPAPDRKHPETFSRACSGTGEECGQARPGGPLSTLITSAQVGGGRDVVDYTPARKTSRTAAIRFGASSGEGAVKALPSLPDDPLRSQRPTSAIQLAAPGTAGAVRRMRFIRLGCLRYAEASAGRVSVSPGACPTAARIGGRRCPPGAVDDGQRATGFLVERPALSMSSAPGPGPASKAGGRELDVHLTRPQPVSRWGQRLQAFAPSRASRSSLRALAHGRRWTVASSG